MSLTRRKPRPLKREVAHWRDDRLFIVACDDTYAPKQYFDAYQTPRVQIHVVPTEDGTSTAPRVLERLRAFEYEEDDELWILLDTDHCTDDGHFPWFVAALKEARQQDVKVCLSKPCFEFWLLLHHREPESITPLRNAQMVAEELRNTLGTYNKTNLVNQHYPLDLVRLACERARRLDVTVQGGDRPRANTSRVYLLWEAIATSALPSQLPEELRGLCVLPQRSAV